MAEGGAEVSGVGVMLEKLVGGEDKGTEAAELAGEQSGWACAKAPWAWAWAGAWGWICAWAWSCG